MEKEILLTYCALPSRLRNKTQETYDFVINKGHAPLHPFIAFPEMDYADLSTLGREVAMRCALRLVYASEQLYLFGISDGTIKEARQAQKEGKNIISFVDKFDLDWKKYAVELRERWGLEFDDFLENIAKIK